MIMIKVKTIITNVWNPQRNSSHDFCVLFHSPYYIQGSYSPVNFYFVADPGISKVDLSFPVIFFFTNFTKGESGDQSKANKTSGEKK